ncbi:unnamed protein product [Cuscuta epithymum]|uniref:IAA-alanine resistance protein 1 n=1 Tax=Cuscuta epithymum TaxID=186058 RepID=A0AAV0G3D1_9ASTE|nr:unnamed protein product [Cuscuta epithymum]CAH9142356.1 unnamed protein product [Cuscuta epithymum]
MGLEPEMAVHLRKTCGLLCAILLIFGSCVSAVCGHSNGDAQGQCSHGHDHHHRSGHEFSPAAQEHSHGHAHHHNHYHESSVDSDEMTLLPEELAEEEDLKLYGFGSRDEDHHLHNHDHEHVEFELSGLGLWLHAMSCSLLVSLASLVCLIILPLIFLKGKPSKTIVDSLALFGAGAMLGDAFLHQLPHAFGGDHTHSESHMGHSHDHSHSGHSHSHSHSLKDLSIGLSILAGILLFLIVEKLVRYVEEWSGGANAWGHGHHHHHHKQSKKLKVDNDLKGLSHERTGSLPQNKESGGSAIDGQSAKILDEEGHKNAVLLKRNTGIDRAEIKTDGDASKISRDDDKTTTEEEPAKSQSSLVFGYLNLVSDGVHNFTDGMALGSAFLLYGSVGGWSRTLFLLAHELPQEIGDFGILVRSGFSVSKALFFNFLSALVALAGTALALVLGQDPGQSSLIEGFTAGGFIYVAIAGVLAETNSSGSPSSVKSTAVQLVSLVLGMSVALTISLVE